MSSFLVRLINYKLCDCCSECFAGCNSLIIRFEHQWTAGEYLAFLAQNGWTVTFSKEMAARIAMVYAECGKRAQH